MTKLEFLKPLQPDWEAEDFEQNGFTNVNEEWSKSDEIDLYEFMSIKFDEEIDRNSDHIDCLYKIKSDFLNSIEKMLKERKEFDFVGHFNQWFKSDWDEKESNYRDYSEKEHEEYVHMVAVESRNW